MQPVNDSSHIKADIKAAIHGFWHFLFTFEYLCLLLWQDHIKPIKAPFTKHHVFCYTPFTQGYLAIILFEHLMWQTNVMRKWQQWWGLSRILTVYWQAPCRRVIICNRPMSSHVTVHDTPIWSNCNNWISIGNWYQELYYFLFKVQCWGWICLTSSGFVQTAGGTFCKMADCHLPKATNSKQFLKNYIWFYVHLVVAFTRFFTNPDSNSFD